MRKKPKQKMLSKLLSLVLAGSMAVSVAVSTSAAAETVNPFTDVTEDAWYYSYVMRAYEERLMDGVGNSLFSPDTSLTREMYVTVLSRLAGIDIESYKNAETGFVDVPSGEWYSPYVAWAYANGISDGIGEGKFGLGSPVTREQMAVFVTRYVDQYDIALNSVEGTVDSFRDTEKIGEWAVDAVERLRTTGIFAGDDLGNFNPTNGATRAEAATVFCRLMDAIISPDNDNGEFTVTYRFVESGSLITTATVKAGDTAPNPFPDAIDPLKDHWYLNQDGTGAEYDFTTPVYSDLILYFDYDLDESDPAPDIDPNPVTYYTVTVRTIDENLNIDLTDYRPFEEGTVITREDAPSLLLFDFLAEYLEGFYFDAEFTQPYDYTAPLTSSITLYAKLENTPVPSEPTPIYCVQFMQGNNAIGYTYVNSGDTVEEYASTVESNIGSNFVGWYTDASLTTFFSTTTPITSDLTLYAKTENTPAPSNPTTFCIVIFMNGNDSIGYTVVNPGDTIEEYARTVEAKVGSNFAGWYTDVSLTTPFSTTTPITSDLTLFAKVETYYTVSFETNGGSPIPSQTVTGEDPVPVPEDPTKPGYIFGGWYSDPELTHFCVIRNMGVISDITFYAAWIDETVVQLTVGGNTYSLGMTYDQLVALAGQPDDTQPSVYGYTYYVFGTETYHDFLVAGVKDGVVVALQSAGDGFTYQGMKAGDQAVDYMKTGDSDKTLTVYINSHDNNEVYAVSINDTIYNPVVDHSESALAGESYMFVHYLNAMRAMYNNGQIQWNSILVSSSSEVVDTMVEYNTIQIFDVADIVGITPDLKAYGISGAGRRTFAGQASGLNAFHLCVRYGLLDPSDGTSEVNGCTNIGISIRYMPNHSYKYVGCIDAY